MTADTPASRDTKNKARLKLQQQVRYGRITRQPCEICGAPEAEAHHDDYDKPLAVRWLCRKHHDELHHGPPKIGRPRRPRVENAELFEKLASLSQTIHAQQTEVRALEEQRNAYLKQALAEGWTHQQIAEATGLTRGRIGQIAATRRST